MLDRPLRLTLLAAASALLVAGLADPAHARGREVSIDSSGGGEGCASLRVRFGGVPAIKEVQVLAVPGGTPLRLHAPASSGLRVSAASRTPFRCRAAACAGASRSGGFEDDEQSLSLGSGDPLVLLSTVNGPVTIEDDSPAD